ncbi:MAG: hypothetical protein AB1Z98_36400, partial [Nannocystaceae bacterium]
MLVAAVALATGCQANTIDLGTDSAAASSDGAGSTADGASGVGATTDVDRPTIEPADDTAVATGELPREPVTMLLAIETTIAPGLPLQAIVIATPGPGTVDLTMQWLSLDVGSTTDPRQPIGEVMQFSGIPVADDGSFAWTPGRLAIPGAANPITGSDILAFVEAQVLPAGEPYCGRVSGDILAPLQAPLDGSTHAMTQIRSIDE